MYNLVKIFLVCCLLAGCAASGKQTISTSSKVAADKIIAMNIDSGGPWMKEIEIRLKQSGFRVLRAASVNEAIEVNGEKIIKYNEASTRYYLKIDARADTDIMSRCFGGGYMFDYIYADLIDLNSNETIAAIQGRGYSEDCPPLSGTIYSDISNMIVQSWK